MQLLGRGVLGGVALVVGNSAMAQDAAASFPSKPVTIIIASAPDGYTMLVVSGNFVVAPITQKDLSYDPIKNFAHVAQTSRLPKIEVVESPEFTKLYHRLPVEHHTRVTVEMADGERIVQPQERRRERDQVPRQRRGLHRFEKGR
jgi:Tripartite tricarboxylate transporter family receptor